MARPAKSRPLFQHQADLNKVIDRAALDLAPASFAILRETISEMIDCAEINAAQARTEKSVTK